MKRAAKEPVLYCPVCYSTKFQTSKVRPEDSLRNRLFQRPVRCKQCNARTFASRSYARWLLREQNRSAGGPAAATSFTSAG